MLFTNFIYFHTIIFFCSLQNFHNCSIQKTISTIDSDPESSEAVPVISGTKRQWIGIFTLTVHNVHGIACQLI